MFSNLDSRHAYGFDCLLSRLWDGPDFFKKIVDGRYRKLEMTALWRLQETREDSSFHQKQESFFKRSKNFWVHRFPAPHQNLKGIDGTQIIKLPIKELFKDHNP